MMNIRRLAPVVLVCSAWSTALAEPYSCVSFDYPPLVAQEAGQPPSGLAVELAQRLFERLGHTLSVTLYPWGRALETARTGGADCIFTIFWSPERAAFLDYTAESILEQEIAFYVRSDASVRFDGDLYAMRALRIGTAHRINYGQRFESMRPYLVLDEAPSIERNFMKLLAGRVDAVVSNVGSAETLLRGPLRAHAHRLQRLPLPIESVPTHIAFSKARNLTRLRDRLDAEIVRLRASAEYQRMVRKHQPGPPMNAAMLNQR